MYPRASQANEGPQVHTRPRRPPGPTVRTEPVAFTLQQLAEDLLVPLVLLAAHLRLPVAGHLQSGSSPSSRGLECAKSVAWEHEWGAQKEKEAVDWSVQQEIRWCLIYVHKEPRWVFSFADGGLFKIHYIWIRICAMTHGESQGSGDFPRSTVP